MTLFARLLLVLFLAVPGFAQGIRVAPLTERASFEIQKDADRLYANLAAIHSKTLSGVDAADLKADKLALVSDLSRVIAQFPKAQVPANWQALSGELRDLRVERKALEAQGATAALRRSDVNARIAYLQLNAALLQLTGKAPLPNPALRRNAALWSLVGAYNSAAAGRADAGWGEGHERSLELFGDGVSVVISRRWRAVDTELEEIARDARNGRQTLAREKLKELSAFLRRSPGTKAEHLERHRAAADALEAAVSSEEILAVKKLIPHPRLSDSVAVSYDGAGKLQRAQLHQLESIKGDYAQVLEHEAKITKWSQILAAPKVSKKDVKMARVIFDEAREWAARGFVAGKQVAAQALEAALAALDAGDHALASRHASWAGDELSGRRRELERVARGVMNRLARLLGR